MLGLVLADDCNYTAGLDFSPVLNSTFVQTLAVPRDPALDYAVLGSGLQHELVEVVGAGHVQCPPVVTVCVVVSA